MIRLVTQRLGASPLLSFTSNEETSHRLQGFIKCKLGKKKKKKGRDRDPRLYKFMLVSNRPKCNQGSRGAEGAKSS